MEGKLGELYVDIITKSDKLKADLGHITKEAERSSKQVENAFQKAKLRFDTSLSTKSIKEIEQSVIKLRAHLERKIKLGAPLGELEALKSSLDKAENAVKTFSTTSQKLNTINADSASKWGMIATGIQSVVQTATQFISGMKQIIGESILTAAKTEGVRIAFEKLNKPDLLDNLRKATKDTISDLSLMQAAVRAEKFKIPLDQLGSLLMFAQRTAQATGQSVDYLVDSIVMGIGRKSPMILDNLGISTVALKEKIGDVNAEMLNVGDFARAVGSIAEEELKKMGDAAITSADQYSRLGTKIEEQKIKIGELINDGLRPLLNLYDQSSGGIKRFIAFMAAITSVSIQLIPLLVQLYTAKKLFALASFQSAVALGVETKAIDTNTAALTKGAVAGKAFWSSLLMPAAIGIGFGLAIGYLVDYVRGIDAAIEANEKATIAAKKLKEEELKKYPIPITYRLVPKKGGGFEKISLLNVGEKGETLSEVDKIRAEIKKLEEDSQKAGLSLKELFNINAKLRTLQAKLISTPQQDTKAEAEAELQKYKNTLIAKEQALRKYYDGVKFEDTKYYQWRADQIINEGKEITTATEGKVNGEKWANEELKKLKLEFWKWQKENDPNLKERKGVQPMEKPDAFGYITDEMEKATRGAEQFANVVSGGFGDAIMAGENLGDTLKNITAQLAGMVLQAGLFAAIMSLINPSNPLKFLGFFGKALGFGEHGGTFQNGKKIAAFAGGGSMVIPHMGLSGDAYPIMVKGGEKVDVTPFNKVGNQEKVLSNLVNRVEALTLTMIRNSNKQQPIYLVMDSKLVGESVTKRQNEFDRGNIIIP